MSVIDWLLESDPALRWRVLGDLVGAPDEVWQATRSRVAHEGFGAKLLALQDPDGLSGTRALNWWDATSSPDAA